MKKKFRRKLSKTQIRAIVTASLTVFFTLVIIAVIGLASLTHKDKSDKASAQTDVAVTTGAVTSSAMETTAAVTDETTAAEPDSVTEAETIIETEPVTEAEPTPEAEPTSTAEATPTVPTDDAKTTYAENLIMGNSMAAALELYGAFTGSVDFRYATGLNVRTAKTAYAEGTKTSVLQSSIEGNYNKIFMAFGENELGWEYPELFIRDYGKLIDEVRNGRDDVDIYILSLFPITRAASAKDEYSVDRDRIVRYNQLLTELASEKSATYVDVMSQLADSDGYLPNELARPDGIHPGRGATKICRNYIYENYGVG